MKPESLLIYYGFPSALNGAGQATAAAGEFGRYRHVVLGDGLQHAAHPDHRNTQTILKLAAETSFYGYVDLGVKTQNLRLEEVAERLKDWQTLGVTGVLLDDFGHDFGVDRSRQNDAVRCAHDLGLVVIANAWNPEDALSPAAGPANRLGQPTALDERDILLLESYQVRRGQPVAPAVWRKRAERVERYRRKLKFRVFSVSTTLVESPFDQALFEYVFYSAVLDGHAATGWGEPLFAAQSPQVPWREPPAIEPGSRFVGRARLQGERVIRWTDRGCLTVSPQGSAFRPGHPPIWERVRFW